VYNPFTSKSNIRHVGARMVILYMLVDGMEQSMSILCINLRVHLFARFDFPEIQEKSELFMPCQMVGISSGKIPLTYVALTSSASYDNLRLYDLSSDREHGIPPFWIIPGHQSGTIASICMFP
jgi:hypothetical protein